MSAVVMTFVAGMVAGAGLIAMLAAIWANWIARAAMAEDRNEFGEGD